MALDKLVDSTQLDSDLTSVANAIRAKSGGSGQLAFPAGFISEIQAIPSGGGELPDEYQEIDWIETDGSSRIDTGVAFDGTKDFILEMVAMFNTHVSTSTNVISGWNAGGTIGCTGSTKHWYDGMSVSTSNPLADDNPTGIEMLIEAGASTNTVSKYTNIYGTVTLTRTHENVSNRTFLDFPLFAASKQSDFDYTARGLRIKTAIIKQGGETLRKMIACYRRADGVLGFFDVINNVFYTNKGTGNLIKGPDVLYAQEALDILLGGAT